MKPRVFIGSSVEGLDTAYAIQQNLLHDVEATVWNQGIFDLSSTTIESLDAVLAASDFAIFVFSPDDSVKLREVTHKAVRDNVLFELGLFIGKLGRARVFFVLPADVEMHIPTDLLGITPGKYRVDRSDNNSQASTGPVCNQIRKQIKAVGILNIVPVDPDQPKDPIVKELKFEWIDAFMKGDFKEAQVALHSQVSENDARTSDLGLVEWQRYLSYKIDPIDGLGFFSQWIRETKKSPEKLQWVFRFMLWEKFYADAINFIDTLDTDVKESSDIKAVLFDLYVANGDSESARERLSSERSINPRLVIKLADNYTASEEHKKAFGILRGALVSFPNDENLLYKCALAAAEINENKIAAFLLSDLTINFPERVDYWGYLGNACLALNLHDQALRAYRRADKCVNGNAEWIQSNIGNLLSNAELPTEAIGYLKRAIEIDDDSDYAHDRLARALASKREREKALTKICNEGQRQLREWSDLEAPGPGGLNALLSLAAEGIRSEMK
jgi:tetratricopeptide (TPR) repeat protein